MPRPCREFSQQEIERVREMQTAGEPRTLIAQSLGLTTASLIWHMRCNRFGVLPKQPGRRAGSTKPLQRADVEQEGQVFGCPKDEWELRMIEVRESWPEDERIRRMNQEVPNRSDNYSLFKKNNPFLDNKSPPGRNPSEYT